MSDSDYSLDGSDAEYAFSDYDDSDGYVDDSSTKGKEKAKGEITFRSLSPDDLQGMIDEDIQNLAAIIPCELPVVSILLRHFHWDRERLLEKYAEDVCEVFTSASEPYDPPSSPILPPTKRARVEDSSANTKYLCQICYDDHSADETFETRCGHRFCVTCWQTYLESKIKEEGQCTIKCMGEGCKTTVDESAIVKLVEKPCYERYQKLVQESYVAANPALRYCPHPSCTQAVHCQGITESSLSSVVPTVSCAENHIFCFGCGLDSDHKPSSCKLVKLWLKNAKEDAGTASWIKANTRTCPKCHQNIEKAGGCNRMLCRHCKYQFCWLCMRKWEVHGYNDAVCSTWKEPDPDENMTDAKKSLEKWLFYFDRFNNHEASASLEQGLVERAKEKVVEVQEASSMSWIEANFMETAVDELAKCRRTLKWTYAMAHFLAAGNKKEMFEDLQANLEKAVEDLSQMLEEPIEADTVQSLRQKMIDKTVYVQKRHELLRQDTAAGLSEGRWQWTVEID
ncbi:hypothetical protein NEOLEDRAFT_1135582 [Neolentinus lepideus HHB14362 ss-1]|uniref:RBR-type E3 ubiquitin transferase n=1 Tax=Neolentinus lepideus HHB14362 ss-1 TaxID=1314782 RepID=A0A165RN09_9AGAM|nr:hypothetical protein NEOLEDRAFT_1135582 [Neolentinus lepideus HHB14362 ss-1]